MAIYLKFRPNGKGYKAEHDGLMYLVYPMNHGYAWLIVNSKRRPFIKHSDGLKYPENIDCFDTTVQLTIEHMQKLLSEHDFKINWNRRIK